MLLQQADDGRHVDVARQRLRHQIAQVVRVGCSAPGFPGHGHGGAEHLQRARSGVHGGVDGQVGLEHAVQLFSAGVNVHQLLLRPRCLDQRVVAGGHLAQPRADGDDQVTRLDAGSQLGVQANAHVTRVQRMVVVKGVLKAKSVADRQAPIFGKALQRLRGLRRPAATAGNHQRPLGGQQHFAQRAQGARVAPGLHGFNARQRLRSGHLREHVFGQDQHHRAGPAVHGRGKGAGDVFGNAVGVVNALDALGKAFGAGAKEAAVVHLLEGLAVTAVTGDVAHQQNHGRGVLKGRVNADRGIGGTRPPRDHANAWAAGELAVGLGHEGGATFLAANDKFDLPLTGMHAVEHGQIAFARHAKGVGHALSDQAVNKKVAGKLCGHARHCAVAGAGPRLTGRIIRGCCGPDQRRRLRGPDGSTLHRAKAGHFEGRKVLPEIAGRASRAPAALLRCPAPRFPGAQKGKPKLLAAPRTLRPNETSALRLFHPASVQTRRPATCRCPFLRPWICQDGIRIFWGCGS